MAGGDVVAQPRAADDLDHELGRDPARPQLGAGFPSHPRRLRLRRGIRRTRLAARRRRSSAGERLSRAEQRTGGPAEPRSRHSQAPRFANTAAGLGAFRRGGRAPFDRRHRSALRTPGRPSGDHLRRNIGDPTQHHRRATARIAEGMTMDYDLGTDAVELRKRLRDLISTHIPEGFLGACTNDPKDLATTESFCKMLASDGLLALAWPKEHGGGGGSVWQQTVLREEMWAHHEPRGAQYMGVNWVGPALMRYGTPEQKARHLSAISAGEVIWCQGFSEPEAGTDLASLRTRAIPDGDGWRVNGQKVWTSYAQMASWCVLAACTDPNAPKPKRLSLFLIPMDSEGITVRPIRSMLGPHHLNECFFDDVRVEQVLGGVGEGWAVIKRALSFERVGIARYARCDRLLSLLPEALGPAWEQVSE